MVFLARLLRGAGPMGAEVSKSTTTTKTGLTAGGITPRNLKFDPESTNVGRSVLECLIVLPVFYAFGCWLLEDEMHRTSRFRDKSALFGGLNPDPENNPSWGPKEPYPNYQAKFDF